MMVDGIGFESIEEFMVNMYYANNYQGLDAMLFFIDARGVLHILSGDSLIDITAGFQSLVPIERHADVFYEEGNVRKSIREKIEAALENGNLESVVKIVPTD